MFSETSFGSCRNEAPGDPVESVDVEVSAVDMMVHWGRCSLTANFLAGYVAPAFVDSESAQIEISIILDELIENAVKFSADVGEPVAVAVDNFGSVIRLQVSNLCSAEHALDLAQSIREVLSSNPEDLFVQQVERVAVEDEMGSRLGFITLSMNDAVRLGAEITRSSREGLYAVMVQVVIDRDELSADLQQTADSCR